MRCTVPFLKESAMVIQVKLFAHFAKNVSQAILDENPQGIRAGRAFEVELSKGSTVGDLADLLALPREEIKITFINGQAQKLECQLEAGDQVGIFPPVGGG